MPRESHEELLAIDRAHVWHPFTQMQVWPDDQPLIIERAEGNYLFDDLGNRYLDGVSSLWVTVHGHRKAEIDAAVRAQLDRVAHSTLLGLASVPSIQLAKRLVDIAPKGLTKVFYSDSGSTSVEVAIKMAYQYWQQKGQTQRKRFVSLAEAYHGDTVGAVSMGGIDLFHATFRGLLFPVDHLPTPGPESLGVAEKVFREKGNEIAALVIEPVMQGAAGMIAQPKGYLKAIEELCRQYGVLLICDEVATGFGRTGTMFAVEQEGVHPDLLCVAKGLTGGYLPLAATLATEEVYSGFLGTPADKRTFFHGHTYTGNPLACAAAIANLDLFESEKTIERIQPVIKRLQEKLATVALHPHVKEIRQRGLMIGVELIADKATNREYEYGERIGHQVCQAIRKRGIILRPLGNVIVLMPPLSLSLEEADWLIDSVSAAITEVTGA